MDNETTFSLEENSKGSAVLTKEQSRNRESFVAKRLDEVATRLEAQHSEPLQPRATLLADRDHIQDQQIDFILDKKFDQLRVQIKLSPDEYNKLKARIQQQPNLYAQGKIVYGDLAGDSEETFHLSETWYKDYENILLHVAKGEIDGVRVRTAEGLLNITIPLEGQKVRQKLQSLAAKLDTVICNETGIQNWIEQPSEEDRKAWMISRYAGQNRKNIDEIENSNAISMQLTATEVLPEYWAPALTGRHIELRDTYGEYAIYHDFGLNRLVNLAKVGAIYSSHERFRRGLMVAGISTYNDFRSGGAEGAFTRTISERAIDKKDNPYTISSYKAILDPSEFDRTDMYAYPWDWYGGTGSLDKRMTPEEYLAYIEEHGMENYKNEQVFNRGVKIKAFAVPVGQRNEVLATFKESGILEMNGKPIDDCVIEAKDEYDLFDISWGRPPRSTQ